MTKLKAKRVSNYELFFDLAVVLAIGQLTSAIHVEHVGFTEILSFFAGCIIMLNIWNNEAFYYNKYGDSRRIDIYTIITLMLWIGNLALAFNFDVNFLQDHFENVQIFNIMLILCYGTIGLQYYLKGRQLGFTPNIRSNIILQIVYLLPLIPLATGMVGYSNIAVLLYLLPLVTPALLRLPFLEKWHAKNFERDYNFPHAVERNQLLTIVTFGESVIATIRTYPLVNAPLEGLILFFGMAGLFMFYMTQTFINVEHHQEASIFKLFYSHALIVISLLFFTVGLEFIANQHHHDLGVLFFIGSVLTFYIGVLTTSVYNQAIYRVNRKVLRRYSLCLVAGCLAFYLFRQNLVLMGGCLILLNYLMLKIGMTFRKQQREHHQVPHPDPSQNLRDFS